jgi:hypothetical protein
LSFKAGGGKEFKTDIDLMVDKFKKYIPDVFVSKEYEK